VAYKYIEKVQTVASCYVYG